MRAFVLTGHGGLDKLSFQSDWPVPEISEFEVLVRVKACGLNNTDVNTRTGWYSKEVTGATTGQSDDSIDAGDATWGGASLQFPRIQGADVCGIVEQAGSQADTELVGKRVLIDPWLRDWGDPLNRNKGGYFGSEYDGGFADYATVHWKNVHPIESDLSDAQLATFATSSMTAEGMLSRSGVESSDRVLITGASGGVGSALVQLANRRGAQTIALASEQKHDALRSAVVPDVLLPRNCENLNDALKIATGYETVTVVADIVGGEDHWPKLIDVLERGGRYVVSGAIAGPVVPLDLRDLYLKDLTFYGMTIPTPDVFANLVGYIERGEIKPILAAEYPIESLKEAQAEFIAKAHIGNIVVTL